MRNEEAVLNLLRSCEAETDNDEFTNGVIWALKYVLCIEDGK